MKIKAKWGFVGDASKLKTDSPKVRAGQVIEDADDEYAHVLIGKGLAEPVDGAKAAEDKSAKPAEKPKAAAKQDKQAKPNESK